MDFLIKKEENFSKCVRDSQFYSLIHIMAIVRWRFSVYIRKFINIFCFYFNSLKLTVYSLFYNDFADWFYIGDTLMEPLFWFVDHFTKVLGPICVAGVFILLTSIVAIAYIIGLPFYLNQNIFILMLALIIGHWLLINVVFYYYMAFTTEPGYPPQGAMITEAVSICKRCIAPKPPRTHHCVVCNRCILKMDHHCPWLNNCIGHFNHRYFFMFCFYSWAGVVFIIIFGIPVAYDHFIGNSDYSEISPVLIDFIKDMTKHVFFKTHVFQQNQAHSSTSNTADSKAKWSETVYHSCIVYAALLCVAVFFVLGGLIAWHARLISNGETSIEAHINKKERARFLKENKVYKNPYDFGVIENWKLFLRIENQRPWWYLIFPYARKPLCNGLNWNYQSSLESYEKNMKLECKSSKICLVKIS